MKVHEFKHEMRTTSAIMGRSSGVQVVFKGDQAATDGKTIYLPALPDDATLTPQQVKIMRGYVDHEAGHMRHSNMPLIVDKYDRWMNSGKEDLKEIHNIVEDLWMEDRVVEEYRGAEKNLKACNSAVTAREKEMLSVLTPEERESVSPMQWAKIAMSKLGREDINTSDIDEFIQEFIPEKYHAHGRHWGKLARECSSTEECIDLAKSIYKSLQEDPEMSSDPEDFDPEGGKDMEDGEPSKDKVKGEKGEGKPEAGEGPIVDSPDLEEIIESNMPGMGTNNGDYKGSYTIYTTENDVEYSSSNPGRWKAFNGGNLDGYNKSRSEVSSVISVIKSKLRRALLARERRDWDFGKEDGKLDTKRLVAGYNRNPSVFKKRKDRPDYSTAVFLLVDQSGSMCGEKIQVAQQCVISIAECLEGTPISLQITGFDASHEFDYPDETDYHRYDDNCMYTYKSFDEPLRKSRKALGCVTETGMRNNADRDAILFAVNTLKKRPETRKVLMVFSDGHPAHYSGASTSELMRHAKIVVDQANSQGIETVGIGIQTTAVKKIYSNYTVVNSVQDLASTAFNKLTKILMKG